MSSNKRITISLKSGEFKEDQLSGGGDTPLKIVKIDSGSPAHKRGLRTGDSLVLVNKISVVGKSLAEALQLIEKSKYAVSLVVTRGDSNKANPEQLQKSSKLLSAGKAKEATEAQNPVTEGDVSVEEVLHVTSSETSVSNSTISGSSQTMSTEGVSTEVLHVTSSETTVSNSTISGSSQAMHTDGEVSAEVLHVTSSETTVSNSTIAGPSQAVHTEGEVSAEVLHVTSSETTVSNSTIAGPSQAVHTEEGFTLTTSIEDFGSTTFDANGEDSSPQLSFTITTSVEDVVSSDNVAAGSDLVISADVTTDGSQIESSDVGICESNPEANPSDVDTQSLTLVVSSTVQESITPDPKQFETSKPSVSNRSKSTLRDSQVTSTEQQISRGVEVEYAQSLSSILIQEASLTVAPTEVRATPEEISTLTTSTESDETLVVVSSISEAASATQPESEPAETQPDEKIETSDTATISVTGDQASTSEPPTLANTPASTISSVGSETTPSGPPVTSPIPESPTLEARSSAESSLLANETTDTESVIKTDETSAVTVSTSLNETTDTESVIKIDKTPAVTVSTSLNETTDTQSVIKTDETSAVTVSTSLNEIKDTESVIKIDETSALTVSTSLNETAGTESVIKIDETSAVEVFTSLNETPATTSITSSTSVDETAAIVMPTERDEISAILPSTSVSETSALPSSTPGTETSIMPSSTPVDEAPATPPSTPIDEISAITPSTPVDEISAITPSTPVDEIPAITPSTAVDEMSAITPSTQVDAILAITPSTPVDEISAITPSTPVDEIPAITPSTAVDEISTITPSTPVDEISAITPSTQVDAILAITPSTQVDEISAITPSTSVDELSAITPSTPVDEISATQSSTSLDEISAITSSMLTDETAITTPSSLTDETAITTPSRLTDETEVTPPSTPYIEISVAPPSTLLDETSDATLLTSVDETSPVTLLTSVDETSVVTLLASVDETSITTSPLTSDRVLPLLLDARSETRKVAPSKVVETTTRSETIKVAPSKVVETTTRSETIKVAPSKVVETATRSETIKVAQSKVVETTTRSETIKVAPSKVVETTTRSETIKVAPSKVVETATLSSHSEPLPTATLTLPASAPVILTSIPPPNITSVPRASSPKLYDVSSFIASILPADRLSVSPSRDTTFDKTYPASLQNNKQFAQPSWHTYDESKITMTHSTRIINLNTAPSVNTDSSRTYIPPTDTTRALNDLLNDPLVSTKAQTRTYITLASTPSSFIAPSISYSKPRTTVAAVTLSTTNDTWQTLGGQPLFRPTKFTPGSAKEHVSAQYSTVSRFEVEKENAKPKLIFQVSSPVSAQAVDVWRPNVSVPAQAADVWRPNVSVPAQAADVWRPNVSVPAQTQGAWRPNVSVPTQAAEAWRPNVSVPTQAPDVWRPNVSVPARAAEAWRPNVSVPAQAAEAWRPNVSVPTQAPDVWRPNVSVPAQAAEAWRPNVSVPARATEAWRPNVSVPGQDKRHVTSQVSDFSSYPSAGQVQGNYSWSQGQNVTRTSHQVTRHGQTPSYQGNLHNEGHSYDSKGSRKQEKLHVFGPPVEFHPEIGYQDKRYFQSDDYQHAGLYDELSSPDSLGMRTQNLKAHKGRGGRLFEKRKKRSDKFIIDDTSIKATAPSTKLEVILSQPPRKELTPWDAAMTHGGNVDAAFSSLSEWEAAQRQPVSRTPTHTTHHQPGGGCTLRRDESPSVLQSSNFNRTARGWASGRQSRYDESQRHISPPRQPVAIETDQPDSHRQDFDNKLKMFESISEPAYVDTTAQNWPVQRQDDRKNYYNRKPNDEWSRSAWEESSHHGNWHSHTQQVPLSRSWHSGSQISPGYGDHFDWRAYSHSPVAYRQPIIPGTDL